MNSRSIDRLHELFRPVIEWKHFDSVSGFIALINPVALVPQLFTAVAADNVEGISTGMYWIFVLIQATFALIGIKSKNLGMFLSMVISVLISLAIIVVVTIKS